MPLKEQSLESLVIILTIGSSVQFPFVCSLCDLLGCETTLFSRYEHLQRLI